MRDLFDKNYTWDADLRQKIAKSNCIKCDVIQS